jgi:hypothetical protein
MSSKNLVKIQQGLHNLLSNADHSAWLAEIEHSSFLKDE